MVVFFSLLLVFFHQVRISSYPHEEKILLLYYEPPLSTTVELGQSGQMREDDPNSQLSTQFLVYPSVIFFFSSVSWKVFNQLSLAVLKKESRKDESLDRLLNAT